MPTQQNTRSTKWSAPLGVLVAGGFIFAGSAGIASADSYEDTFFAILGTTTIPVNMATQQELLQFANEACYLTALGVENWDIAAQLAIDGPFNSAQFQSIVGAAQDSICLRPAGSPH